MIPAINHGYELVGQCFGQWRVLRRLPNRGSQRMWETQCSCGTISQAASYPLIKGLSLRCNKCAAKIRNRNAKGKKKSQ